MTFPVKSSTPPEECRIAEIVQYTCDVETEGSALRMNCYPIPRIFKLCPGRPSVEITKLVNIDADTGEVNMSRNASTYVVKGKAWRDVVRCEKAQHTVSNNIN